VVKSAALFAEEAKLKLFVELNFATEVLAAVLPAILFCVAFGIYFN